MSGKIESYKHTVATRRDIPNDPGGKRLDIGYDQGENILDLSVVRNFYVVVFCAHADITNIIQVSPTHPIPLDFSGDCSSVETAAFFDPVRPWSLSDSK